MKALAIEEGAVDAEPSGGFILNRPDLSRLCY